jgi:hypothetical protein
MGEAGAPRCLEIIHKELDVSMALCGKTHISHWAATPCCWIPRPCMCGGPACRTDAELRRPHRLAGAL